MAGQRGSGTDPKEAALAAARCLNPRPEQVTDPEFLASDFFDARDAVQVKYEMVRKVKAGGSPVTEAAADQILSLPMHPHLTREQQERVVDLLDEALRATGAFAATA